MFNGTPTQNFGVKTVPSKNSNSNPYTFITINFSNKIPDKFRTISIVQCSLLYNIIVLGSLYNY